MIATICPVKLYKIENKIINYDKIVYINTLLAIFLMSASQMTTDPSQTIETGIPGVTLGRLLHPDDAQYYFDLLLQGQWSNELERLTQQFYYTYSYTRGAPSRGPVAPQYIQDLTTRIFDTGVWSSRPSQIIVNHYEPGQGISPHVDDVRFFQDEISTLSLGSGIVMEFRQTVAPFRRVDCYLPVGYMLIMRDEARYQWTHGIAKRKSDVIDGVRVARGTRISITWRSLLPSYKAAIDGQ